MLLRILLLNADDRAVSQMILTKEEVQSKSKKTIFDIVRVWSKVAIKAYFIFRKVPTMKLRESCLPLWDATKSET